MEVYVLLFRTVINTVIFIFNYHFFSTVIYLIVSPQAIAQSFTLPPFGGAAPVVNAQQNIVVDTYNPSGIYSIQKQSLDCSDTIVQLCNQEAWTDFGLAISGIIPKNNLCL